MSRPRRLRLLSRPRLVNRRQFFDLSTDLAATTLPAPYTIGQSDSGQQTFSRRETDLKTFSVCGGSRESLRRANDRREARVLVVARCRVNRSE